MKQLLKQITIFALTVFLGLGFNTSLLAKKKKPKNSDIENVGLKRKRSVAEDGDDDSDIGMPVKKRTIIIISDDDSD